MSIIATIETGVRDITGSFETRTFQGKEYVAVFRTDKGEDVGIPMDKTKIKELDAVHGLAVHRFYQGKLPLADCSVLPEVEP